MPPYTSPQLTSPGDVSATGGRHRRPASADGSQTLSWASPRTAFLGPLLRSAVDSGTQTTSEFRSARHRAGDTGSYSTVRTSNESGGSRRRSRAKRPVTGSHRAPGTLPLEAWLAAAKNRPTTVLGTLLVIGLLITAVPLSQPDRSEDPGALAAAQASAQAARQHGKTDDDGGSGKSGNTQPDPTTGSTAKPTPEATVTGRPAGFDPAVALPKGAGPGRSLLTTGGQQVALTFDDGPDPEQTPKILAMLDQYRVKATFCLVGSQAQKHPEIVREIVAAGHTLCNHTFDHDLTIAKKTPAQIRADLARTNAAIRAAVPGAQIPFFRAPGGNFNNKLVKAAYADGMASLYWKVDPRDWEHLENESDAAHIKRVIATVKKRAGPGAIILSHDFNQPDTIAAYKELLPWLAKNFQLGVPSGTGETPASPKPTEPTPASPDPSASASTEPADPATDPAETGNTE